jgi:hypothetical protein
MGKSAARPRRTSAAALLRVLRWRSATWLSYTGSGTWSGPVLGAAESQRVSVVPTVVASFLLQPAVHGWCPPVPIFRRAGRQEKDGLVDFFHGRKAKSLG